MPTTSALQGRAVGHDRAFLANLREDLLRFARLQLGNDDEAEDAVQEALAGAMRNSDSFRREAALRTWTIAILKNKIADVLRQRRKRPLNASDIVSADEPSALPPVFDQRGLWYDASRPSRWENPEADLHEEQFLAVFDSCLNRLPARQGKAFMMREIVELQSDEICLEMGLSPTNLYVLLHRARLSLRACLAQHWLNEGPDA